MQLAHMKRQAAKQAADGDKGNATWPRMWHPARRRVARTIGARNVRPCMGLFGSCCPRRSGWGRTLRRQTQTGESPPEKDLERAGPGLAGGSWARWPRLRKLQTNSCERSSWPNWTRRGLRKREKSDLEQPWVNSVPGVCRPITRVVRRRDGCTRGYQQGRGCGPARSTAAPAFRLYEKRFGRGSASAR
jgi:hypothetical protein